MVKQPIAKRPMRSIGPRAAAGADQPQPKDEPPGSDLVVPRALQPASMRFAAPETKLSMTAAIVSKPTQSVISAKTGVQLGPGRPVRVRVIR
jgi:hypothetical protein